MGANLPSVDLGSGWMAVEVAAGWAHTCVRLQNGAKQALKCWGYNNHGQLGLGDTNHRGRMGRQMGNSLPAVQLGTWRSALALALGGYHSCALLGDAMVKCWGWNNYGGLGMGDTQDRGDGSGEMGDSLPSVPLCLGPCPVGYTGADGEACSACLAGMYKALAGSVSCAACPLNTISVAGSNELTDCACLPGYTAASDGVACAACDAGTFKSMGGAGSCAVCPLHSTSAAGSNELANCTCVAGYTAASDGVACAACEAGTYKAIVGSDNCTACPAHSSSAAGSSELTDCACLPGYTAASDGVVCAACDAGTFKGVAGTAACETCPANAEASSGSARCECSVGFALAGGSCIDACPAAGDAVVSPCAVAPTCTVSALHVGYEHSCALFSHGGVR